MVQSLLSMVPMLLGNALLFVLSIGIMAYLSPLLTLVALAIAPALWLIAIASRRKLFPASWDAQQKEADVAGVVDGAVTGVRVVKGFGQEEQEIERLEGVSRGAVLRPGARRPADRAVQPRAAGQSPCSARSACSRWAAGWPCTARSSSASSSPSPLYIGQMVAPVRALTSLITIGQEARASVIRVYEVIDSQPVVTEKPGAMVLPPGTPDVELDDVTFGYLPSQPVLRGPVAARAAGRDARRGRHLGVGQVDDLAAAAPLLRRAGRRDPGRRPGRPGPDPGLAARLDRAGDGGQLPVLRHDPRQHRLRPARRDAWSRSSPRPGQPRRTSSSPACRTATTP